MKVRYWMLGDVVYAATFVESPSQIARWGSRRHPEPRALPSAARSDERGEINGVQVMERTKFRAFHGIALAASLARFLALTASPSVASAARNG
jgi:hypothetical protein